MTRNFTAEIAEDAEAKLKYGDVLSFSAHSVLSAVRKVFGSGFAG
jgi:hypothetical protein